MNRWNMSIRNQIIAFFSLLVILVLLVPYLHLRSAVSRNILHQTETSGKKQLRLLQDVLKHQAGIKRAGDLQDVLQLLGKDLNLRLSYISVQGRVIADSGVPWEKVPEMADHSDRPEVIQALSGRIGKSIRYSETLHTNFLYLAVQMEGIKGVGPGVLRLATPYSQIEALFQSIHLEMLLVVVLVLGISCVLSWLLTRQIGRQIAVLSQGLKRIGTDSAGYEPLTLQPSKELQPIVSGINELVKRVDLDLQIISRQRDELDTILNSLEEGVMLLDQQKKIRRANKALEKMSLIPGNPVGRKPIELFRNLHIDTALDRSIVEGSVDILELWIKVPRDRFFQVRIVPVRAVESELHEFIVVLQEITQQRRLEQMRKDFVANVSHELKTPLTSIKGYAETVLESDAGEKGNVRPFMEIILRNVEKMNSLLRDLLQLARLEAVKEQKLSAPVDLSEVIQRSWEVCAPLARDKQVTLVWDLPESKVEVLADSDQLVRVLVNLLENALKYGPVGQEVTVRAEETDREWIVSVADQGPGIPESIQDRLFERFFSADADSPESGPPGSGLGLAICKHILENRGGSVWVRSPAPGRVDGSVFSFSLLKQART